MVREGAGGQPPTLGILHLFGPPGAPTGLFKGSQAVCSSLPASDVGGLMSRFPRVVGDRACAQWLSGSPLRQLPSPSNQFKAQLSLL